MTTDLESIAPAQEFGSSLRLEFNPGYGEQLSRFFADLFHKEPKWQRLLEQSGETHVIRENRGGVLAFGLSVSEDGVDILGSNQGIDFEEWQRRALDVMDIALRRFVGEQPQKIAHMDLQRVFHVEDANKAFWASIREQLLRNALTDLPASSLSSARLLFDLPCDRRFVVRLGSAEDSEGTTFIRASFAQLYGQALQVVDRSFVHDTFQEANRIISMFASSLMSGLHSEE